VIDADISPRALKLYCVLSLYADGGANGDGGTTRSRVGVAARLSCSVDTLDRAANELEKIGAIERIARFDGSGDRAPNRWRLFRSRLGQRRSAATGGRESAAVGNTRPPTDPDPQLPLARSTDFEDFYAVYPRKAAVAKARKAWPKAVKAAGSAQRIVDGALRLAEDPNLVVGFAPYPASWLNAEQWDDPPLPPRIGVHVDTPDAPRLSKSRQNIDRVVERMNSLERAASSGNGGVGRSELASGDH
jgi:hypothetical protein